MVSVRRVRDLFLGFMGKLFRPLQGKAWISAASIAFFVVVGLLTFHLWREHGSTIISQPRYRLNPERLIVTPTPEWIRSDILESAVTHGRLHNANLLEPDVVLQVKQAFGVQPWVKRVLRVNKKYPSTVEVELEYRRPVAMVEVPPNTIPGYPYRGLLPVDDEGYLLPVEVTEDEAQAFPMIGGIDSSPSGTAGTSWGDPRIADATQIVLLLEDIWDQLGLFEIKVPPRGSPLEGPVPTDFVLVTKQRIGYVWGPAPGKEPPGSRTAEEKAAALRAWAEQNGRLDAYDGESPKETQGDVDLSLFFKRNDPILK